MQFFSQHSGIQLYLYTGKLFITAIIFSLEKDELGKKIYIKIGEMSDFVREKKSHWCEWKGSLPEKSSSATGNAVPLCSSWLYNGEEKMDRLTQHPSSAWSCCLPPALRPRQQAQATSLHKNPAFCRGYWRALTGFRCWTIQTRENEEFTNENAPQAVALGLGVPGLGDGSSAEVPACVLRAVHNADITCLKIPFLVIREAEGSNKRHTLNFGIAKILWSNDFSWICKHLVPLQSQALLLGMVDIKPGGLH